MERGERRETRIEDYLENRLGGEAGSCPWGQGALTRLNDFTYVCKYMYFKYTFLYYI